MLAGPEGTLEKAITNDPHDTLKDALHKKRDISAALGAMAEVSSEQLNASITFEKIGLMLTRASQEDQRMCSQICAQGLKIKTAPLLTS